MSNQPNARDKSAPRASSLVWLLVLLGLATGAFTLFVVWNTLGDLRAQRMKFTHLQDVITSLSTNLSRTYGETQTNMHHHLSGEADNTPDMRPIDQMVRLLDTFNETIRSSDISPAVTEMKAAVRNLGILHEQCLVWSKEYAVMQASLV